MAILVQREFTVAQPDRARFEELSRTGVWPSALRYGSIMAGYGIWAFGGRGDVVVTHTVYQDMEHWLGTRAGGRLEAAPGIREEAAEFADAKAARPPLIKDSRARILDLDDHLGDVNARPRAAGEPIASAPPTWGRGSVISELCYELTDGAHRQEFERLSHERIWSWLETQGARLVAFGRDPLGPAQEVVTLFAFRSLEDWYRLSRPTTELHPPPEATEAWNERHRLIVSQRGRLLRVATDWGTPLA